MRSWRSPSVLGAPYLYTPLPSSHDMSIFFFFFFFLAWSSKALSLSYRWKQLRLRAKHLAQGPTSQRPAGTSASAVPLNLRFPSAWCCLSDCLPPWAQGLRAARKHRECHFHSVTLSPSYRWTVLACTDSVGVQQRTKWSVIQGGK